MLIKLLPVASLRGEARAGCHHFGVTTVGVTPCYDVKPKLHRFVVKTFVFFTLVGPHPHLDERLTDFAVKTFFFRASHTFGPNTHSFCHEDLFLGGCLYLSLDRKRVPSQNPAPGATFLSSATACCFGF